MRIARFGDTYAGGYAFALSLMDDTWQSARPVIAQRVSGASGAFDHYGSDNFPISPLTAVKKFAITSSVSSADIEDSLNTLRNATIAAARSKLWWLDRDETTKYWQWAKCIRLKTSDTQKEKGRWAKNVEIEFYMPEGVWYGETQVSTEYTTAGPHTITNNGNVNALLYSQFMLNPPYNRELTNWDISNAANSATVGWSGSLSDISNQLVIDAENYIAEIILISDEYANLTFGSGQVAWMWLDPGSNAVTFTPTFGAGAAQTYTITVEYWHTYVF
jgi:hypothetical protein